MQFIKVTKKGNVKVEHDSGVKATAYFVAGGHCPRCALRAELPCQKAPCTPGGRAELGLPREDGCFTWDKP